MIVCLCKGTTDATVRKCVRDGARTIADVGKACFAGSDCEGCLETLAAIIAAELLNAMPDAQSAARLDTGGPIMENGGSDLLPWR